MQLGHPQRQLLSRCTLRWYSAGAAPTSNASDPVAASGTPVSPRLKRPLANSFGGINIQNVAIPSQKTRNGTNKFPRSRGSDDKSPDQRRMNQAERYKGRGNTGASSLAGWGDGLVTLRFSDRLKLHQQGRTARDTRPPSEDKPWKPWKQQSQQTQPPQMQGHRRDHEERSDAALHKSRSQSPRAEPATKSTAAKHDSGASAPPKAPLMTRPSPSTLKPHARPTTTPAPMASRASARKAKVGASGATKANPASSSSSSPTAGVTAQKTSTTDPSSAGRSARLTALSSTNLNALFRTRDALGTGVPLPVAAQTSTAARVRGVLERSAGDYSRFLPRSVGVRKSASSPPALRTARHALAVQRDLSPKQRRVAMHIIEGLTRPHQPQVRT